MDTTKLCFGCFSEHDGNGPCPHCGYDLSTAKHPFVALPIGTILNGRYLTGRVLGVGGFGVTYLAFDMTLEISVAVKEFLPSGIALRESDHYTMTVSSPDEQNKFDNGVSKFLEEARLLAKLRDVPNIVTVHDYFRENNTAYFVMEYIEGVDLMKYTQNKGGKLTFDEALRLLLPIIDSLAHVHDHKLLHRDISPDNIVVMKNGSTRLLDFGAARLAIDSDKSKSIILKHGFAPEEQYRKHGNQGPWSDEYALAATMYLIITGVMPPDAIERVHEDTLVPPTQLGVQMPQYASDALMKALSVSASGRFPDMKSFGAALSGNSQSASAAPAVYPASSYAPSAVQSSYSSEQLPTAATGTGEGQMVGGKTVAMEQERSATTPSQVQSSSQVQTPAQPYTPEKVLSPSILVNDPNAVPAQSQVPSVTLPTTATPKKSIWKKPLTYVLAGLIALAGIGTAVGVYIAKNYEWGEETTKKTSRKTKRTTTETSAPEPTEIPDPVATQDGDFVYYEDQVRQFTVGAPKDFSLENSNGLFCMKSSNNSLYVYTDLLYGFEDMRLDSLSDFIAQAEELIPMYMEDQLSLSDAQLQTDYLYIHRFNDNCAVEYSGTGSVNGQKMDATIVVTERRQDKGVFISVGLMPVDDYGMYSQEDCEQISSVLISLKENTSNSSDYTLYDFEGEPCFLYKNTDVESVTPGKIGNFGMYDLQLKDISDPDSKVFIIDMGNQASITAACTAAEQALGTSYKFGGYTSVTPTINSSIEIRIRNYTLSKIDDAGTTLDCTACVLNLNGYYYCVVSTCGDTSNLERIALDFTLTVKTMLLLT